MNNDKKGTVPIFEIPKDLRERAVWLRRWTETMFNVYGSVIVQAAKAMPNKSFDQIEMEIAAAKMELMNLINPEKWEGEDESE